MTRTVNGEHLFGDREKEMLRKMIWQLADFCGVEVLTYCVMANHFHVLLRVPDVSEVSDKELLRRYRVLYPKPTKYQTASIAVMEKELAAGGDEADAIRSRLLARMGDVSEYMKAVKQRFSVWYNRSHDRYGTLWSERFKSVLVEGKGNPLQTMAGYIDLNPVRAGLVEDPKDYRFCGYAEAVAHSAGSRRSRACRGIEWIWRAYADGSLRGEHPVGMALQAHRELIFGKRASDTGLSERSRDKALKVLEREGAILPKATVLRCRVRYFTDGAVLGSQDFVRNYLAAWQIKQERKRPPRVNEMQGADWGDMATLKGLRRQVFS
jgi:REP element-mobilizing transposase RayT